MNELLFVDRYTALGIPYPDPKTVCKGQCEGTGFVPIRAPTEEPWLSLWLKAQMDRPSANGYQFVRCPNCEGTGKRQNMK